MLHLRLISNHITSWVFRYLKKEKVGKVAVH